MRDFLTSNVESGDRLVLRRLQVGHSLRPVQQLVRHRVVHSVVPESNIEKLVTETSIVTSMSVSVPYGTCQKDKIRVYKQCIVNELL